MECNRTMSDNVLPEFCTRAQARAAIMGPGRSTSRGCKRVPLTIAKAVIVIPIIKGFEPIVERADNSRTCVSRLVAADMIRTFRCRR